MGGTRLSKRDYKRGRTGLKEENSRQALWAYGQAREGKTRTNESILLILYSTVRKYISSARVLSFIHIHTGRGIRWIPLHYLTPKCQYTPNTYLCLSVQGWHAKRFIGSRLLRHSEWCCYTWENWAQCIADLCRCLCDGCLFRINEPSRHLSCRALMISLWLNVLAVLWM